MVRYSKASALHAQAQNTMLTRPQLAFRQTVHEYGTDICWTPMILAKEFNRNEFARDSGTARPRPHEMKIVTLTAQSRPHHRNTGSAAAHGAAVRRQQPPGTGAGVVPRGAVRVGRRSQLRVSPVVGVRGNPGRGADGAARARARHGDGDERAAASRRVARRLGERHGEPEGAQRERQDTSPW